MKPAAGLSTNSRARGALRLRHRPVDLELTIEIVVGRVLHGYNVLADV
jgi:hypothetical protein